MEKTVLVIVILVLMVGSYVAGELGGGKTEKSIKYLGERGVVMIAGEELRYTFGGEELGIGELEALSIVAKGWEINLILIGEELDYDVD